MKFTTAALLSAAIASTSALSFPQASTDLLLPVMFSISMASALVIPGGSGGTGAEIVKRAGDETTPSDHGKDGDNRPQESHPHHHHHHHHNQTGSAGHDNHTKHPSAPTGSVNGNHVSITGSYPVSKGAPTLSAATNKNTASVTDKNTATATNGNNHNVASVPIAATPEPHTANTA